MTEMVERKLPAAYTLAGCMARHIEDDVAGDEPREGTVSIVRALAEPAWRELAVVVWYSPAVVLLPASVRWPLAELVREDNFQAAVLLSDVGNRLHRHRSRTLPLRKGVLSLSERRISVVRSYFHHCFPDMISAAREVLRVLEGSRMCSRSLSLDDNCANHFFDVSCHRGLNCSVVQRGNLMMNRDNHR